MKTKNEYEQWLEAASARIVANDLRAAKSRQRAKIIRFGGKKKQYLDQIAFFETRKIEFEKLVVETKDIIRMAQSTLNASRQQTQGPWLYAVGCTGKSHDRSLIFTHNLSARHV